ncbi:MAG: AraC family transcriptional regulator [Verrucomicrobiota bacterium]|nr:AraC family transcriptional regulator [Limisphaera sp.]MDW8381212.1 AraC family transcriptional regulator [Verrucomicrobiota bacterium]
MGEELRRKAVESGLSESDSCFSERAVWGHLGDGWQPLFGSFKGAGYSLEWHDFTARRELDWGASFHPSSIEICLNLSGEGYVAFAERRLLVEPDTAAFYHRGTGPMEARRAAGQRHQFLTLELSTAFLRHHLAEAAAVLHPMVQDMMAGRPVRDPLGARTRLTAAQRQMIETLRRPPVYAAAQPVWYRCKAVELAVVFLVQPAPEEELFCTRQQRLAQERVERAIALLKTNLSHPPSLEELGRRVGCSPFYLSRIFSAQMGMTIPQYIRELRLERAAELLRSGRYNVTEAALEVGYNSLSHFSQAFHERFGCCPGLYPIRTPTQSQVRRLPPDLRRDDSTPAGPTAGLDPA